jgi:hypothetical protein
LNVEIGDRSWTLSASGLFRNRAVTELWRYFRTVACELMSKFQSAAFLGRSRLLGRTMRIDQELDFLLTEGLALTTEAVKQPAKRKEWRERSKNWKKRLYIVRKAIKKMYGDRI